MCVWSVFACTAYLEYAQGIRKEYDHLEDEAFTRGRASVLDKMLGHPRLYRSAALHAALEDTARANMTREKKELELNPSVPVSSAV
jgi:predicted metal-dependent HD superfamily phosphohydrolase